LLLAITLLGFIAAPICRLEDDLAGTFRGVADRLPVRSPGRRLDGTHRPTLLREPDDLAPFTRGGI
jgi:hypothetical protein